MKEDLNRDMDSKKIWNPPKIIQLDIKKTQNGSFPDNTEDFASGTISTLP